MTVAKVAGIIAPDNAGQTIAPPNRRRRWLKGSRDPVAQYVADHLLIELRAQTIEHLMRELPHRVAAIVRGFRACGDDLRRQRFMAEILAANEGREAPPLCPATWQRAEDADNREESAEVAYHTDPSDANLERLIRASEEEHRWQDARLLALYAERDRRRRVRA